VYALLGESCSVVTKKTGKYEREGLQSMSNASLLRSPDEEEKGERRDFWFFGRAPKERRREGGGSRERVAAAVVADSFRVAEVVAVVQLSVGGGGRGDLSSK
jgi:hypothetical protein